jgi:aryl-alcohol dehydrogenase-like predicted oxidoreductase
MKYRTLGWTGIQLSEVGLGTWAMGGGDWAFSWGAQDDELSLSTIEKSIDLGINWIDTAAIYGLGHSEEVVGRAIKKCTKKPFIATKFSRRWDMNGNPYSDLSPQSVRLEVEASLKRLGVEVIDLYQMHWPRPDQDLEAAWSTVSDLVKEGKVLYAGVCNFSKEQLLRIMPIHPVASLQPPYSMLRRTVESVELPFCAANQIGVIVYSPMQKGILTQKFTRSFVSNLPPDDHRLRDPDFQEPLISKNLSLVKGLEKIAINEERSIAEVAISWVLRNPEVTSAIVGARKPSQIEETQKASGKALSKESIEQIEEMLSLYLKER